MKSMSESGNLKSILGRFWLSQSDESTSIPGVMEFNSEGASVTLEGSLTGNGLLADVVVFARIQGDHGVATLFNCFGSAIFKGGKAISSQIDSTLIALGYLQQDLTGHAVQFRLPGSETWFHEQCFDVKFNDAMPEVVVQFKNHESYRYDISNEMYVDRFYSATVPFGNWGSERFEVKRPLAYRISFSSNQIFDELWQRCTEHEDYWNFSHNIECLMRR